MSLEDNKTSQRRFKCLFCPIVIVRACRMATFTKIEEGESPSILIHPSNKIAKINDNIYGGFTE
jgi:hypothetical protein